MRRWDTLAGFLALFCRAVDAMLDRYVEDHTDWKDEGVPLHKSSLGVRLKFAA